MRDLRRRGGDYYGLASLEEHLAYILCFGVSTLQDMAE
jgi:hypothetical protein